MNIDEDLGNWHPEDLLEEIHAFHIQDNYLDRREELIEDEIHQKVREDLQDLSEEDETNDNPSAFCVRYKRTFSHKINLHKRKKTIFSQSKENEKCLLL